MTPRKKRLNYLTLYFLTIGIAAFIAYRVSQGAPQLFVLTGPPLYIAYLVKKGFVSLIVLMAEGEVFFTPEEYGGFLTGLGSSAVNNYVFLLPCVILYYGVTGFLFSQIRKERGKARGFATWGFLLFIFFLHYICWRELASYFIANPSPL